MTVAPDGERMAVASANGMELVDLRTGRSRLPAEAEGTAESEGQLVTFSPDGALLASGDSAGRVSLRDGRTGALLGTVHAGDGRSGPVFLDAHRLLLQHFDGEQYVWDTSDDWARFTACRIVGRGLTRAEWRAVFGDRPYLDVCPAQVVTRLGSVR